MFWAAIVHRAWWRAPGSRASLLTIRRHPWTELDAKHFRWSLGLAKNFLRFCCLRRPSGGRWAAYGPTAGSLPSCDYSQSESKRYRKSDQSHNRPVMVPPYRTKFSALANSRPMSPNPERSKCPLRDSSSLPRLPAYGRVDGDHRCPSRQRRIGLGGPSWLTAWLAASLRRYSMRWSHLNAPFGVRSSQQDCS